MPVIYQKQIKREDLKANPEVLYLFGDNEQRKGLRGQAKEMRGEPNAVGIRTKAGSSWRPDDYWSDKTYDENKKMIDEDLEVVESHLRLKIQSIIVIPLDGLGTGLSMLAEKAPKTFEYLEMSLKELKEC